MILINKEYSDPQLSISLFLTLSVSNRLHRLFAISVSNRIDMGIIRVVVAFILVVGFTYFPVFLVALIK